MRCSAVWMGAVLCACASQRVPSASEPKAAAVVDSAAAPAKTAETQPSAAPAHVHPQGPWTLQSLASGAKLLGKLGEVHRPVSKVAEAQAFFDQGLALSYGFNHDEAARSFAYAAQLDTSCAMCFWGAAYTLGPNYNMPMLPERAAAAWQALVSAERLASQSSPVEQALIAALKRRYQGPEYVDPAAMTAFNVAYAEAMRTVARSYPDDLDVQVLFAEALMNVNPWQLWDSDGEPAKGTLEIVRTLEQVLAREASHAGANHYYIHAVEASRTPERAVPAAERLPGLVPGAGHIVHMPAHIYQRVGRYADASEANRRAIVVDKSYLERMTPPGYYAFYSAHNYGFLAYSAAMQGRSEESFAAARQSASAMPKDVVCGMPGMDFFLSEPLLVLVRFGRWPELLNEPQPDANYPTLTAIWHHARGMALASTDKLEEARAELTALRTLADALPEAQLAGLNSGRQVLALAAKVLEARIAERAKAPNTLALWQQAVALEDRLAYNEPADWFYPTRHFLGAALLDAGKAKQAEQVYRQDLQRHPENGWALFGLTAALAAQRKYMEAETRGLFQRAFRDADFVLTRSAF